MTSGRAEHVTAPLAAIVESSNDAIIGKTLTGEIAQVGSWSWDAGASELSFSAQMYAIFGRDPGLGPPDVQELLACVHEDDRDRVTDAYAQVLRGRPAFEVECRIVTGDQLERTVHALARADRALPGCWRGTVQDVTRDRQSERERLELLQSTAGRERESGQERVSRPHEP